MHIDFMLPIPKFQDEIVWTPEISIEYEIKRFEEESVLKEIESFRKQFCSSI